MAWQKKNYCNIHVQIKTLNKQIQAMRINHLLSEILFRHFLHYLRWITTESVVSAHDVPNIQISDMLEMKRFMNLTKVVRYDATLNPK